MAFIDCEGFDLMGNTVEPGNTFGYGTTGAFNPGVFSYGNCFGGNGVAISGPLPSSYSTIFANFHWKVNTTNNIRVFSFKDSAGTYQFTISQVGSKLTVLRGDHYGTGVVLATGPTTIIADSWYFLQLKLVVNSSTGSCILKIGEVEEINVSGVNTQATANANVAQWYFSSAASNYNYIDNLVFYDETGGVMDDFTPETRVFGQFPTGDGALTEWTPSAGANYENVNEAYDTDTTYNSADTAGMRDLYAYPSPVPAGTAVYAIKASATFRKDDVGENTCNILVRSGGSNYEATNGPFQSLGSYLYHSYIMTVDPNTGLEWTITNANAIQTGIIRKT